MKLKKIAVVVFFSLTSAVSVSSIAAMNLADARSVAMGGTGVVAAEYLTSPFHNPALGAIYRNSDDFGLLLPGMGAQLNDSDDLTNAVKDASDTYDSYQDVFNGNASNSSGQSEEVSALLDSLTDKAPVYLSAGVGMAAALPNQYLSINVYAGGYADVVAMADIGEKSSGYDASDASDVKTRFDDSEIGLLGVVETEVGVSLSGIVSLYGQTLALGISPKIQQYQSYANYSSLSDFSIDDFDQNKITANGVNLDAGAVWIFGPWRIGAVAKDMLAKNIDTAITGITYQVKPKISVGAAFDNEFFVATIDADLTKETRFTTIADDTRFVRVGLEGDAWGWAQLRVGYAYDMEGNVENSLTAGVGFSPFNTVNIDLAAIYASENSLGASMNMALTF